MSGLHAGTPSAHAPAVSPDSTTSEVCVMISLGRLFHGRSALALTSLALTSLTLTSLALTSLALASLLGGCGPKSGVTKHDLTSTEGRVRFSTKRQAFYERQWISQVKATSPRICAGFVHSETFERYLKYGKFELQMTLEVFKGGSPKVENGQVTGWQGGKLLRTIRKRRPVSASNSAYVWCGRLQKGGRWKEGAMRYTFELKGPEPAMDEFLAQGIVQIVP